MNKIYKLVWSKTKNMYVAVCEFAKSHTKSPSSGVITRTVVAGVLASVLSCGAVFPVFAAGTGSYEAGGGNASGDYSVAIGDSTTASASHSYVIGYDSSVNAPSSAIFGYSSQVMGGEYSYIVGSNSTVLNNIKNALVFGNRVTVNNGTLPDNWTSLTSDEQSELTAEGVIALGNNVNVSLDNKSADSRSSTSLGSPRIEHVVALGDNVIIGEENAIGIGFDAKATALNSLAVGQGAEATGEGSTAVGETAQALGHFANASGYQAQALHEGGSAFGQSAVASQKFGTAFGRMTKAVGESATAIGNNATAQSQASVAIGLNAIANGGANTSAVAIGNNARIGLVDTNNQPTTGYGETVAIGGQTSVTNTYGTAIGSASSVTAQGGTALGANASVTAANSVAIGRDSVADAANTVSVGHSFEQRRIVNVAAGTASTNAATVGQTVEIVAGDNVSLSESTNAIGQKKVTINATVPDPGSTYTAGNGIQISDTDAISAKAGTNVTVTPDGIHVVGNGSVTDGNTGLINGGTLYNEVHVADGNSILADNTVAGNLTALDRAVGAVSAGLDDKANISFDNINNDGKTVVRDLAKESVKVVNGTNTIVTEGTDGVAKTYAVNVTTNGVIANQNAGIVTGGVVYDALQDYARTNASNLSSDNVTSWAQKLGIGSVAPGNQNLVIGDVVYNEVRPASDGVYIQSGATAGANMAALDDQVDINTQDIASTKTDVTNLKDLSNITSDGENRIAEIAVDAIDVTAGNHVTVTPTTTETSKSFRLSVNDDGVVEADNEGLVTGDTVYRAIQAAVPPVETLDSDKNYILKDNSILQNEVVLDAQVKANADAIDTKASTDLDNISTAGHDVIKSDAKASVNVVGGTYATVAKTDVNGVDTYTVNVATDGAVASGDIKLVTGDTVYRAIEGKASTDLSNITSDGHTVIRNDAKSSVNVVGGTYATVVKTDVDGVDTYTVNVDTSGTVTSGDTKLVTGDTVFNAIDAAKTEINNTITDGLDGKANVAMDNLTEAGTTAVSQIARDSITVTGDADVTVTPSTTGNVKDFAISINKNGIVANNDTGIVTGGTVYNALESAKTEINNTIVTGLDGKANVDMDNLTETGITAVSQIARDSITVTGNADVTVMPSTTGNVKDFTLSINTNGSIANNDTGIVTGGTVYNALQGYTRVDASNVGMAYSGTTQAKKDNAEAWANSIGIGQVAPGDQYLLIGDAVYNEVRPPADGHYILADNTAGQNAQALDEQVNVNTTTLSGQATEITQLKNMENITATGIAQIKEWAAESLDIQGSDTINVASSPNVSGGNTYTISAKIEGAIDDSDTGLVDGGTLYSELRPESGTIVQRSNTTAQNLKALETNAEALDTRLDTAESDITQLKDLSNITTPGQTVIRNIAKDSVKVINGTYTTVTEGTDGNAKTYAVNVAADGAVASGDTGLVTGGVVYDYVQSAIGSGGVSNVVVADGDNTTVTSTVQDDVVTYRVKANATGSVSSADTGLVDGGTVYNALQSAVSAAKTEVFDSVATDLAGKANVGLDNISSDGQTVVKDLATDAVAFENGNHTQVESTVTDHVRSTKVNVVTDGVVAEGNSGIVTGGTVYDAIDIAKVDANNYTDSTFANAANKSLSNINDDAQTLLKDSAISAVKLVDGQHTTVGFEDKPAGREYHVDVASDGLIESNNTGLVTGGIVFNALATYNANLLDLMGGFLDNKADIDLGNINDSAKSRVRSLAQTAVKVVPGQNTNVTVSADGTYLTYAVDVPANGTVSSDSTGLVNGSTVYNEVHTNDGNYISASNSASQNLTALDTNLKALSDRVDNLPTGGGTDENAVHYDGADKSKVTMGGTDGTVISNVKAGVVDSDAATVGQLNDVASALGERVTVTENLLAGDWEGKTVKQLIDANKASIDNVSDRVTTIETTVSDHSTAISDLQSDVSGLTSTVESHAGALSSLDNRMGTVETAVNQKANVSLDNIDDAGKAVISDIAKDSVAVGAGDANINVIKTSQDGKDTYNVSVNTNGTVAEGDTGIVTGGTVYDAIQNMETKQSHYYSVNETHRDEETYNNGGATGEDALAIGIASKAEGNASVAIGRSNVVSGYNSTAVGVGQTVAGDRSGAFGDPNTVNGDGSYVMGNDNVVDGDNTFVMGSNVNATGNNSVVLGNGSDGSQSNVVSVGAENAERKIVHVDDGVADTDAVNVRQLKTVTNELGGRVKVTEDLLAGDWGGNTVKEMIDKNAADIDGLRTDMGNKANVDASNIDVDKFTDALGTGDVVQGNQGLVKGGVVYDAIQKIRDTNITLSPDGTTLNVGAGNSAVAVDFTNSNGEGRVLQGVITNPNDPTSAANVGYVDAIGQGIINGVNDSLQQVDTKINKVGAGAAAMASLAPLPFDDDDKWNVSAAVGTFHSQTAGAVGVFYKPQENVMLNLRGSFGNGENMAGAGITLGLNKGAARGLSKVSMAKAMNAQANEIMQQKNVISDQQRRLDEQQQQIVELKKMFDELKASKK